MKNLNQIFVFFLFFFSFHNLLAQKNENEERTEKFNHNQIGAILAHTHMKTVLEDASSKRLSVPSMVLFYNYHFNEKWSLGLHTDFVVENFVATSILGESEAVERKSPIAPAIMVGFKPGKHFTFLLGGGIDVDKEETLGLIRFDSEYGLEITKGWEFIATLGYDIRFKAFDSFQIGVGMSKNF